MNYPALAILVAAVLLSPRSLAAATFHVEHETPVSFAWVRKLAESATIQRSEFKSLDASIQAQHLSKQSVSVWADPIVGIGPIFYDSDCLAPSQFGDIGYSLRQSFPKRGEKSLLLEDAEIQSTLAQIEREVAENRLRTELYQALIREAEIAATLGILAEDLQWIQTIVKRKEDRFRVQQAGHDELMSLQNEQGLQELKLTLATNQLNSTRFRIQRLLSGSVSNAAPRPKLPIPLTPIRFQPALVSLAKERNPALRWLQESIHSARNAAGKAALALQPKWSAQVEARQYSGDGGFREGLFQIGISIPWVNQKERKAGVIAKEHLVEKAEMQLAEAEAQLEEQLHTLTLEMDGVDRSLRVHRDEIQLRRQEIAASAQSAWEVNRGSLDELLSHRRQLIADRLRVVQLTARLHHVAAEIVQAVGVAELNELPN